jgi:hypothetical protein
VFRSTLIRSVPSFAAIIAGILLAAASGTSTALFAVSFALMGLGAVGLVALFFYEVGRSEDRDRDRDPR